MEIELDMMGLYFGIDKSLVILSYNLGNGDCIGELWYSRASYYTEGII